MKYPWWKPVLIVLILAGCGALMYPPSQRLKPGLDLAGGTTLIYDVRVPEKAHNTKQIIDNLIEVLRNRVDPNGTRNLIWKQIAGNRIQIQMALASPAAKKLRQVYLDQRQQLLNANVAPGTVNAILRESEPLRTQDLKQLAGDNALLLTRLENLAKVYDRYVAATGPYQEAQQAFNEAQKGSPKSEVKSPKAGAKSTPQDHLKSLQKDLIQKTQVYLAAKQAFEAAQAKAFAANVDPAKLEKALNAPKVPAQQNQPSRADELARLKKLYPTRAAQIDQVAKAYAAYEQVKGPLDDPNDLIHLLQGSGVLEFRIAAVSPTSAPSLNTSPNIDAGEIAQYRQRLKERGPRAGSDQPWRWFAIDDVSQFADTQAQQDALEKDPATFFAARGLVGAAYGDHYYVLLGATPDRAMTRDQKWSLESASRGSDQLGRNAVNFTLDAPGGDLMGAITGANIHKPMAILLDHKVISAPTLQSQINGRGQITGSFSDKDLDYLLRTLHAGSSEAELAPQPSSINTTGPELGQDNLRKGLEAVIVSLIVVGVFMAGYYFLLGLTADFSLIVNMVIILGIMSLFQATFTLPGIAGIVLTIGMAVDSNVLIYERIREELDRKAEVTTAVRLGFEKALATIVDANLTTFIVGLVLYYTATADIKGFAVTLMVGIIATLFASLFVTRVILDLYVRYYKPTKMRMLPTIFKPIHRLLSPNIDWMGKRRIYVMISLVLTVGGGLATYFRGTSFLDVEFRSGTQVTFTLKDHETLPISEARHRLTLYGTVGEKIQQAAKTGGQPLDPASLPPAQRQVYPEVQHLVQQANERFDAKVARAKALKAQGKTASDVPTAPSDFALLKDASVVTQGETNNGRANGFKVVSLITDTQTISDVIKTAFSDVLDVKQPIEFAGMNEPIATTNAVYPITSANLGEALHRPDVTRQAPDYVGGVAFILRDMKPAATLADLHERIRRMSLQPQYEQLGYRQFDVIGLQRAQNTPPLSESASGEAGVARAGAQPLYRSAVVIVRDAQTNYEQNPDTLRQQGGLADTEWSLIEDAVQRDTSLASVSNFSPGVSGAMQQKAAIAVILSFLGVMAYLWVRFGSLRWGIGAVIALLHDVITALGALAICGWIYDNPIAHFLLIEPFKLNMAVVAALLTIIGYSVNDTVVVFDRIREDRGRLAYATPQIINDAINQTFSRTILTAFTVFIAVMILYIVAGSAIRGFALTFLVGTVVGCYSSIAVASPLVYLLAQWQQRRKAKADQRLTSGNGNKSIVQSS